VKRVYMGIAERREREREQRQQDIIEAAERVFFSKGYEAATMDEVSEEAELSKGTLYLYFNTKEELYFAVTLRGFRILYGLFEKAVAEKETGFEQLREIGRAYVRFFNEHRDHFKNIMFFESKSLDFEQTNPWLEEFESQSGRIFGKLTEAIETGIEDGTIRADLNPIKTPLLLWGQSNGILQLVATKQDMLTSHFDMNPEELIDYYFQVLTWSIRPEGHHG
jgi:TetR/AcrR family transcriptional regulator